MSLRALSHTIDYSSNTGATFIVELMVADSVNDQNSNLFWMSTGNLAKKARVARLTANRALLELERQGILQRIGVGPSGSIKYRWHPVTTNITCDEKYQLGDTTSISTCDDKYHKPQVTQLEHQTSSKPVSRKTSAAKARAVKQAIAR